MLLAVIGIAGTSAAAKAAPVLENIPVDGFDAAMMLVESAQARIAEMEQQIHQTRSSIDYIIDLPNHPNGGLPPRP